jgi:hypothetical protein
MQAGLFARRRKLAPVACILVGIAIAALVVIGLGPRGAFLTRVTTCELGAMVGNYTIWTPDGLVNIPDGGSAHMGVNELNFTMSSGSLTVGGLGPPSPLSFGFSSGFHAGLLTQFDDWPWTFYSTRNVSTIGESAAPCTQPYVATVTTDAGGPCGEIGIVLPLADNTSDAVEPHIWNGTPGDNGSRGTPGCPTATPGSFVWFDSSFHTSGSGWNSAYDLNLCNFSSPWGISTKMSADVPIVVHVPDDGGMISAAGFLTWNSTVPHSSTGPAADYTLPGGWLWEVAPVGPIHGSLAQDMLTPGSLAFERLAC